MALVEVKVPDIGDFKDVVVIEMLVKPGDTVKVDQSLMTVESDKASMEIPSSHAGVVKELKVAVGDVVNEGSLVLMLEADGQAPAPAPAPALEPAPAPAPVPEPAMATPVRAEPFDEAQDRPVEAPVGTSTSSVRTELGTSAGSVRTEAGTSAGSVRTEAGTSTGSVGAEMPAHQPTATAAQGLPHASPSVRRFARELGVPLQEVKGTGPKGRITQDDVQAFTKAVMAGAAQTQALAASMAATLAKAAPAGGAGAELGLIPWPKVDFSKFGPIERKELGRIKKISGANLLRNAVMIPAVTNHDDADITELEAFRVLTNKEQEKGANTANGAGAVKVTMLAFLIKACVAALKKFPEFNSSLDGDALIHKHYWHIGFAADTPNGLMVPVVKDADKKGVLQISQEMAELAKKARDGKLGPADMSGATFTISSLGGIGGRYFTPIINAPEVAILGVCKSDMAPKWDGKQFVPRLMLPLSLTWDHRVIDGAAAARFNAYLGHILADFRRVLL
ncbi:MAG: dihydrolipoyllysine-residue acetyltransferase [Betaproteobacteria bacterium]|jgi:pyruvate dehydrogenase E2 component (dihydrolipoamide acetyltransferase)